MKDLSKMFAKYTVSVFLLALSTTVSAHDNVVVVPFLEEGADLRLNNIVSIAKKSGDFEDPIKAMESITDASESNPYIMVISPGVYNLGVSS